ncbi:Tannase/feruloyl esterase [Aspergillus bertholletiae]|uniref:Carboxylic ester hydrolase n=1 Tax=Aspergillus bertholletiae TaxID=1226010 RepID=A0A5N7AUI0_9EURO|nr:Tannase/feruloyl esterase [Aspergillus bertholletiae]
MLSAVFWSVFVMFYDRLQSIIPTTDLVGFFTATFVQAGNCSSSVIPHPSIPGGQVLDLSAVPVSNYAYNNSTIDFCNVTVTYTHPGKNDTIHATVWLPSSDWNNRLQGSGGGGFAMRSEDPILAEAVAQNYTVVATDGGHDMNPVSSASWALNASGNVNMALLEDFAYVALGDAATIGKQVAAGFYGLAPRYSYWNGCSTGGRQGLMLAQRYPTAYNGIMAAAPAINWASFLVAEFWPQFVMNQLGAFPPTCVSDAITAAAVKACDEIDGVLDGVISAPGLCDFDPFTIVDTKVNCNGVSVSISHKDAQVARSTWEGLKSSEGSFLWYGLDKGTPLSMGGMSLGHTECSTPFNCTGSPFPISSDWIRQFILRDPSFDLTTLDHKALDDIFTRSKKEYNDIIGTDDPNLSAFKQAGGKMLTWHGLSDTLIFPKGTEQYYKRVEEKDPFVRDFYRYFEAPGAYHCSGGVGPVPVDPLSQVVDWVENGVVPETVDALAADGRRRNLCLYPLVSVYKGGDVMDASSYQCEESF